MASGFVLNSVFDRLHAALKVVESIPGITFATSTKYGYVTSCPSNLGTGMRASVHLKIPNLTADGTDDKAKAAAKPLGLSVRGTGGEHTPIGADGTVDISPSNRLFITEAEIVTKLYNGIKLLLEKEAEAAPQTITADAIARGRKILAQFPENRCVKYLLALQDSGVIDRMDAVEKAKLFKCVKTGLENPDSGLGCYAMEPADYDKFAFFFDKVCNDYHKNPAGDKVHTTNWSLKGVAGLPADGVLDISKLGLREPLSMRVRVGRNLSSFPLPGSHLLLEYN